VTGVDFTTRRAPRRPGDPATLVAKADRIRAELGWKPGHDTLEEIVAAAFRWEKSLASRNI
jgi:UDP-glucose 4-epimerase